MTLSTTLDDVLRKWQAEGISLLPPAGEASVISTLDSTGRKYSRDVVSFYCATGGMEDNEPDSNGVSFWPLEQVVSGNSSYARPYIMFADVLNYSRCYCFRYEEDERSSVCVEYFNAEEPEIVADSIEEFFNCYLRNPEKLRMAEFEQSHFTEDSD